MSVADRIAAAQATLPALLDRIGTRRVVLSTSGGKDSTSASLFLKELGIPHTRVFMDTGWEHPELYSYLRGRLTSALGPINEVRSTKYPGGMSEMVVAKGLFPTGSRRFCTEELKIKPLARFIRAIQDDGSDVLNVVGIRAEESDARAEMPEWDDSDVLDCDVWRPLIRWTEQDVIEIHQMAGLEPCRLYLREGVRRVGCWPCVYARKSEILAVATSTPEKIDQIRDLEREVSEQSKRMGHKIEHQTWFRAQGTLLQPWPIDEAVKWSRTSWGGRQFEMFAAAGRDAGCVRWGMCDLPIDPPEVTP